MAKIVYWDIINGDDALDGLAILPDGMGAGPVRTLTAAQAAAANGDRIIAAQGVYPASVILGGDGNFDFTKQVMLTPQQAGLVILDFEQTPTGADAHITMRAKVQIKGIYFRNMAAGKYAISWANGSDCHIIDCLFYQRDGAANAGRGVLANGMDVENCSFYNLERGVYSSRSVTSCYFVNVTTETSGGSPDYNAYPGNTEPNGIDTDDANSNPGFVSAAAEDFRLDDTDTTAIEKFRTLGQFGGPIGATGASGPWWDARFPQSRWISPDPVPGDGMHGSWINDPNYEDPGGASYTGEVVEDVGDFEPIVDTSVGGNPDAKSARFLGPVIDWGDSGAVVAGFFLARFIDAIAGAVIDTDVYTPSKYEVRESASSFDQDDDPTPGPAWTEVEQKDGLNLTARYQQPALTFQLEHTNGAAP